jgi:hypothetical protein
MATNSLGFKDRPELAPRFIADVHGLPGFNFLGSIVMCGSNIESRYSYLQINGLLRIMLGQTIKQIAGKLLISPDSVQHDLENTYETLGIPAVKGPRQITRRSMLLPRGVSNSILKIVKFGSYENFPAYVEDMAIIGMLGLGLTYDEIAKNAKLSKDGLSYRFQDIGSIVGFSGRELLLAGAILTKQVSPYTCLPIVDS